jgi:hypothetical protein
MTYKITLQQKPSTGGRGRGGGVGRAARQTPSTPVAAAVAEPAVLVAPAAEELPYSGHNIASRIEPRKHHQKRSQRPRQLQHPQRVSPEAKPAALTTTGKADSAAP